MSYGIDFAAPGHRVADTVDRSCCRSMMLSTIFKRSPMRVPLRRCNYSPIARRSSGRRRRTSA
jgi:hypothetical protein